MNEQSIKRLKKRIIKVSVLAFTIIMLVMGALIYIGNSAASAAEIHQVLEMITENGGEIPNYGTDTFERAEGKQNGKGKKESTTSKAYEFGRFFGLYNSYNSPEFLYSTRYFSIIYNKDGSVQKINTEHIASVDENDALSYARVALKRKRNFGRVQNYYFLKSSTQDGSPVVVALDSTRAIAAKNRILSLALIMTGFTVIVSWLVLRLFADRMVRPEIKNAELQKSFITNASHELKTPLAVIRANTELTEATSGKTEWTEATMRQVDRMQGLIDNLVEITKAQESNQNGERKEENISSAITATVKNYESVAKQKNITLLPDIPEKVMMKCDEGQIRQLASILLDNAMKYCDDSGEVKVNLSKSRKIVTLSVSNNYKNGENVDTNRFFDRFYREDKSHNTDKGGYGIGLSIAQSIVKQYRGKIGAAWKDGIITFTCKLNE